MLTPFLAVYEEGYATGLRRVTTMPSECNAFPEAADSSPDELIEVVSQSAYQEGFVDGFRDGLQALAESPGAVLASARGQTLLFTIEVVNMVSGLRQELHDFFHTLRSHRARIGDSAARLREALSRAEGVINSFPEEGTEAFLAYRWVYVQLISLIDSARRALG